MLVNKLIPVGVALAALALAGCGGGTSVAAGTSPATSSAVAPTVGASGPTESGPSASNQAARQAYRDCLAKHGVNLPQRTPGQGPPATGAGGAPGSSIDPATMQAAQTACASLRPAGGFGGGGAGANPQVRQAFQAYLSCLKDHGVTVPTTVAGQTGGGGFGRPSFDQNDPTFQAANKVCRALLPVRPTNGSTATTTTAG